MTARKDLKKHIRSRMRAVTTIRHLAAQSDSDLAGIGISEPNRIEIREVLACRGLP